MPFLRWAKIRASRRFACWFGPASRACLPAKSPCGSARCRIPCRRISRILEHAGLVRAERSGRTIRYVADMTGLRDLLAYLMEDCCNGTPELCRPVIEAVTCNC